MVLETHGQETERTAELISAYVDFGHLDNFAHKVHEGHPFWHCICLMEDDLLRWSQRNRWCAGADDWLMAVGYAQDCVDERGRTLLAIEDVPKYVGWGAVKAWLVHESTAVVIQPGVGLHLFSAEDFDASFRAQPLVVCAFRDDSAILMNAEFKRFGAVTSELLTEIEEAL